MDVPIHRTGCPLPSEGPRCITCCVPALALHLSPALFLRSLPCPAVSRPCLGALAPAAHAAVRLAAAVSAGLREHPAAGAAAGRHAAHAAHAADFFVQVPPVAGHAELARARLRSELAFARFHLSFAAALSAKVRARPAAGKVAGRHAAHVADFFVQVPPAAGYAEAPQALLARAAADNAAERLRHAADNGNSGFEAPAAAPLWDTDSLNIASDRQAEARAREPSGGPIDPIRFDAAPIHYPNAGPSVAAHLPATLGRTAAAAGNSARGFAKCTTARTPAPRAPKARCTTRSRTSHPLGTPSTGHRRKNNSNSVVARSKPGSPAPARVPGTPAG